jgi:hypothetical protein
MAGPKVRRVVTGHNPDGMAIIQMDEIAQGERFTLIWTTEGFPVDKTDERDGGRRDVGITLNAGTVFRVGEIASGKQLETREWRCVRQVRSTIRPSRDPQNNGCPIKRCTHLCGERSRQRVLADPSSQWDGSD